MLCPRCGIDQPKAVECVNCGIVVKKFDNQRRFLRATTVKEKGLGTILVLVGALILGVLVVAWQWSPSPPEEVAPPPPVVTGPVVAMPSLEDFWTSGATGFRRTAAVQQERKVAMLVWFYRTDCPECVAVETGTFRNGEVRAWLAQNERVRMNVSAGEEERVIAEKFGVTTVPAAFVVRSDGERHPLPVFLPETTTPVSAAEFLKSLRALAGR